MSTYGRKYTLNEEGKNFICNFICENFEADISLLNNTIWTICDGDDNYFYVYSDSGLNFILITTRDVDKKALEYFIELTPEELSIIDILQ